MKHLLLALALLIATAPMVEAQIAVPDAGLYKGKASKAEKKAKKKAKKEAKKAARQAKRDAEAAAAAAAAAPQ